MEYYNNDIRRIQELTAETINILQTLDFTEHLGRVNRSMQNIVANAIIIAYIAGQLDGRKS